MQGGQRRVISAQMAGKFARAPLPTIGAAAGEFAHPTAQISDSPCQTANAALSPGGRCSALWRTGWRLFLSPSGVRAKRERSAGKALVRPCDRPHLACVREHAEGRLRGVPVPLAIGALALRRSTADAPTASGS